MGLPLPSPASPKRRALWALLLIIISAGRSAGKDLIWDSLRSNLLRLDGFSRRTRALIYLGFGGLFVMTAFLLTNDFWRASLPLLVVKQVEVNRAEFIPSLLAPLSLLFFTISWTFILVGALHSHIGLRWGVVFVFFTVGLSWSILGISAGSSGMTGPEGDPGAMLSALLEMVLAFVPLLLSGMILFLYIVRSFFKPRPFEEFIVFLALLALLFGLAQLVSVNSDHLSGLPLGRQLFTGNLMLVSSLVTPLLWLVGVDMALFALQAAAWGSRTAQDGLPKWLLYGLLAGAVVVRLYSSLQGLGVAWSQDGWSRTLTGLLGALVLPLLGWAAWKIVYPVSSEPPAEDALRSAANLGEDVRRHAFPLIILLLLPGLLTSLLNAATTAFLGIGSLASLIIPPVYPAIMSLGNLSLGLMDILNSAIFPWRFVFGLISLGWGLWALRRGEKLRAVYLLALGGHLCWIMLTEVGWPLAFLYWRNSSIIDFWLVMSVVALAVWSIVRRQMTPLRAAGLLFLVFVSGLRQQTDFISNPFNPLLTSTGIGLVAFGVVWDALNIGSWANQDTPSLSRHSRLFLYLGYVLLTVTLINWAVTSHSQTDLSILSGASALRGFQAFGAPLFFLLFPLVYKKT